MVSQTMMKEGKDAVHRAATPSIFPYFLSGCKGFSGSHSSLEMVSANVMRH